MQMGPDRRLVGKISHYFGGFAHVHTRRASRSGHARGEWSLPELVQYIDTLFYSQGSPPDEHFVAITEHASNPGNPRPLAATDPIILDLLEEQREISTLQANRSRQHPQLFFGLEVSILPSGRLDIPDTIMAKIKNVPDPSWPTLIIASRHTLPKTVEKDPVHIFQVLTSPMANPYIDVIGHPNRYVDDVGFKNVDWAGIFNRARVTNTAIEINLGTFPGSPEKEHIEKYRRTMKFWRSWLAALKQSGASVAMGVDLHQYRSLRHRSAVPDPAVWTRAMALIQALEESEIPLKRVVNRSTPRLREWLSTPKNDRGTLLVK